MGRRNRFKVYAFDAGADELGLTGGKNAGPLTAAIDGHVIGVGELTGLFEGGWETAVPAATWPERRCPGS